MSSRLDLEEAGNLEIPMGADILPIKSLLFLAREPEKGQASKTENFQTKIALQSNTTENTVTTPIHANQGNVGSLGFHLVRLWWGAQHLPQEDNREGQVGSWEFQSCSTRPSPHVVSGELTRILVPRVPHLAVPKSDIRDSRERRHSLWTTDNETTPTAVSVEIMWETGTASTQQ